MFSLLADTAAEPQFFLERLAGQSFTVILLVSGIWIVGKMLIKTYEGRISDLKERLDLHRALIQECEADRRRLWERITGVERKATQKLTQ